MPSRLLQEVEDYLCALNPQTAAERAAIDLAIACVARGQRESRGKEGGPPAGAASATPIPKDVIPSTHMPEGSPFYGKGLREACPMQLALARKPQLPREIW